MLAMFSVTTVFLLLASLVAAAGFAVVAQRRLRHLGMLAAVGATEKQLRLVLLANGAIVGAIAALVGTAVGLAAWFVFGPALEPAVDHRVDRLNLPLWLIATTALLAILGATDGRLVAGASGSAPAGRARALGAPTAPEARAPLRDRGRRADHVGVGCLALSNRERELLIIAGIVATIVGCLLLGPLAIRVFSSIAGRVSIAPRLALRDLVRHQARSGAALAAVTLALGIAATIVVIASAEEAKSAAEPPNLSDRQVRVYLGPPEARKLTPVDAPAQLPRLGASVRQLAGELDNARAIPLRKAKQPGANRAVIGNTKVFLPLELTRRFTSPSGRKRYESQSELYVATPGDAQVPRSQPGVGRPEHELPRRPQRPGRRPRDPDHAEPRGDRRHERPEDRHRRALLRLGDRRDAGELHHPRCSEPPRVATHPGRVARRVEPTADERLRSPVPARSRRRRDSRSRSRTPAAPTRRRWPSRWERARSWRSQSWR